MSKFVQTTDTGLAWNIPLEKAPQIVQIGRAVHGKFGGPSVDKYRLPDLWCLHIYQYEATLELDGHIHRISPGTTSIIPPGTTMVYRYGGISEHCFCHFQLDGSIVESQVIVPAVQHIGSKSPEMYRRLSVAAMQPHPSGPRGQALVWDLLWSLAESEEATESPHHPALLRSTTLIEQNLSQPIHVAELAKASGVSYSYLSRLFRAELGVDVVGYIRQRRGERAGHLLNSTTLPIKSIAASVGIPDLAQFNRLIHRTHGCSPTDLRGRNFILGLRK